MATQEENRIIEYLKKKKTITRLECDGVSVSLPLFLDIVASLCYRRVLTTTQRKRKSESGRDLLINVYSFTEDGKKLYKVAP